MAISLSNHTTWVFALFVLSSTKMDLASDGCACGSPRQYNADEGAEESGEAAASTTSIAHSDTCDGDCSSGGDTTSTQGGTGLSSICGDGILQADEACDDGNEVELDGCELDCQLTPGWPCGDGLCSPPEDFRSCEVDCPVGCGDGQCDNGENAKTCGLDCEALCGQGVCEPQETPEGCPADCPPGACQNNVCDDGEDPGICPEDCHPDECGNNICEPDRGEDDILGPDHCPQDCPFCGDGVTTGDEQCDDANDADSDGCSNDCVLPRRVFLAGPFTGNLGGVGGADAKCSAAAKSAKLGGKFMAWLSDSEPQNEPAQRFKSAEFTGWYLLPPPASTPVANGWLGLTGQDNLKSAINRDASGSKVVDNFAPAWTNTLRSGQRNGEICCNNWSFGEETSDGLFGVFNLMSSKWTEGGNVPCSAAAHIYCVQVEP